MTSKCMSALSGHQDVIDCSHNFIRQVVYKLTLNCLHVQCISCFIVSATPISLSSPGVPTD